MLSEQVVLRLVLQNFRTCRGFLSFEIHPLMGSWSHTAEGIAGILRFTSRFWLARLPHGDLRIAEHHLDAPTSGVRVNGQHTLPHIIPQFNWELLPCQCSFLSEFVPASNPTQTLPN